MTPNRGPAAFFGMLLGSLLLIAWASPQPNRVTDREIYCCPRDSNFDPAIALCWVYYYFLQHDAPKSRSKPLLDARGHGSVRHDFRLKHRMNHVETLELFPVR